MAIERTDYFAVIKVEAEEATDFLLDVWTDPAMARLATDGDHLEIARFREVDIEHTDSLSKTWVNVNPFVVVIQGLESTVVKASVSNNKRALEISNARFSIIGLSINNSSSNPELQKLRRRIYDKTNTPYITLGNSVTLSGQGQLGGRLLIDRTRQDHPTRKNAPRQYRGNLY